MIFSDLLNFDEDEVATVSVTHSTLLSENPEAVEIVPLLQPMSVTNDEHANAPGDDGIVNGFVRRELLDDGMGNCNQRAATTLINNALEFFGGNKRYAGQFKKENELCSPNLI